MDNDDLSHIGTRHIWGGQTPFGLHARDRRHHLYIIGKTGTGKSTLLRNLMIQDIEAGRGLGLIDPHGDLAEDLLDHIPPWRTDHVVYFNPADREFPVALNLLAGVPSDQDHLVASGVVSAFKSIWRESWGPRLEYVLYAAVAALQECKNTSMLGIQRLLVDERYRRWILKQVSNPAVRAFWLTEFANYDKRFLSEMIAPVQNKVGQILMAAPIRNVLGQVKSKVNPRFVIDNRRIFIANLAKGRVGEDKANLLGALIITQFQLAAMARVDLPEHERQDFQLFIDEFHNFSTDSFVSILSEARKYRLCLTLSHQYVDQLHDEVRDAVFGNAGSLISFRVGQRDALVLEREFGNRYSASQFTELGNHEILAKILSDGEHRDPFFGTTLPPFSRRYMGRDNIIHRSRQRYAVPRAVVDDKIKRWVKQWM